MVRQRPQSPARALRAAFVSLSAILLAAVGHVAGGGEAPPPQTLLLVCVVSVGVCWRLSADRWSVRTLTGVLLLTQGLMHLACGMYGGAPTETDQPVMVASHLVATLVSVVVLVHGERALGSLLEATTGSCTCHRRVVARPVPVRRGAACLQWIVRCSSRTWASVRSDPLRGPPAAA